ncbi:MAG: hypothetical protein ABEH38_06165 [Flavobacteriales bacterium]
MKEISVQIELPDSIRPEILWAWDLFASHIGLSYRIVDDAPALRVAMEPEGDIPISHAFEGSMRKGMTGQRTVLPEEPLIRCADGRSDPLGTAFYMVNSVQEWNAEGTDLDRYGRFSSTATYQYRFGVFEKDLVSELFEALYQRLAQKLPLPSWPDGPSRVFLTHDIDRIVNGDIREAVWSARKGKILRAGSCLLKRLSGPHEWDNIREILALHEESGFKSCFFWLPEKGKDEKGVLNADHDVKAPHFQELMREIEQRGFWNGLHKSSFEGTFATEFDKLTHALPIDRNHYLMIRLPDHYERLEREGFRADSSLGFSDSIGFRNSYGLPFHPFDTLERKKMNLLEIPLHIMDSALHHLEGDPMKRMEEFIETHQRNRIITVLWHNNLFSKGKFERWRRYYLQLLDRLQEGQLQSFDPKAALEERA